MVQSQVPIFQFIFEVSLVATVPRLRGPMRINRAEELSGRCARDDRGEQGAQLRRVCSRWKQIAKRTDLKVGHYKGSNAAGGHNREERESAG